MLPQRRRATYQRDAPSASPQARKGRRGSQRQYGEYSGLSRRSGSTSRGAAVTRESSGECWVSKPVASCEISSGKFVWRIGEGRAGDARAVKLTPAGGDAGLFGGGAGSVVACQLGVDEPQALRQEGEEQGSG